jgi:hypothetical protein
MPLTLTFDALQTLNDLATPIDNARRPQFLQAVARELTNTAAIGPGSASRAARAVLSSGEFWTAPPDLRQGRVGPRGPRNA